MNSKERRRKNRVRKRLFGYFSKLLNDVADSIENNDVTVAEFISFARALKDANEEIEHGKQ